MKRDGSEATRAAVPKGEATLYERIRELVVAARQTVARGVDLVQVHTNFEIGRHIVEHEQQGEQRAAYGQEMIKALAERLTADFGRGFSQTNLKLMRLFYLHYQQRIGQSTTDRLTPAWRSQSSPDQSKAVGQPGLGPFALSWTHYVFLLGVKKQEERTFYEIESAAQSARPHTSLSPSFSSSPS